MRLVLEALIYTRAEIYQVTESSDPEVSYRDHPPEVSSQAPKETEKLSRADNGIAGGPTQKSRTRWKLILGGIVILVVAVALGVGLGVGLSRRHGNHTNKEYVFPPRPSSASD